ncbi:MAG: caspase family protein [Smithellaceae bacterium]|nr:caspase family protein [Syntrophaceae bacterium]MDD4241291.1 caspase family protein [Smithellaceae bacterium]NLX52949.1 DUF2846 domain-containing protein [Deltaproteobacteria bacterium]
MKKKLFSLLLLIVSLLLMHACASVPLATTEEETRIKNIPPPPDKALLYVYRDNLFMGSAVIYHVYIDEQRVGGSLAVNNFLAVVLEPGEHRFSYVASHLAPSALSAYLSDNYLPVQVDSGRKYYIKISAQSGPGRSRMVDVLPESFQNAKLIDKSRQPAPLQTAQSHARPASPPAGQQRPIPRSDVDTLFPATVRIQQNSYAIVIGVEEYREKLPKADFAVNDARVMGKYFSKSLGIPEENLVILTNDRATKSDMEKYFHRWLQNNVTKESELFIYFSGHGAPDPANGDAYLVPYDGDPAYITETGYPLRRLYEVLNRLPSRRNVVILDSCFSGAGDRSVIAKGLRPLVVMAADQSRIGLATTVLSASAGNQVSSTYLEKGHGLLTYYVLKGLKEEKFLGAEGRLDIEKLYPYVRQNVERVARKQYNNAQTPQLIGTRKN